MLYLVTQGPPSEIALEALRFGVKARHVCRLKTGDTLMTAPLVQYDAVRAWWLRGSHLIRTTQRREAYV